MYTLKNYVHGEWIAGKGKEIQLFNSVSGEAIASTSTEGIDYAQVLDYGRNIGGPALRKMTFTERGVMLKKLALHLYGIKEKFYTLSAATGATRIDSWIDIEGGIGNLFANASLRKQFPDLPYYIDGDSIPLSKQGHFSAQHICVPKEGVALHINAYNFPIWGMLEKIAVNIFAGVPAVVKPATVTSYLTELMVQEIIASKILPEGALQLLVGSARGIIDHVGSQDVVTFTGSAWVGRQLKASPSIINNSVPFNLEADSLNASVLGADAKPGTAEFDIFIKEVAKEMTVKGGQKCTAIRRVIVHESLMDDVQQALSARLAKTVIGDPLVEGVRMGALAGIEQRDDVIEKVNQLAASQDIVYGSLDEFEVMGADYKKGAFLSPILFRNDDPFGKTDVHNIEAFGPVSTLLPYSTIDEAIEISKLGKGSLVASIVTNDDNIAREFVLGSAAYHGRILVLNNENAKESTGHGSPLPMLTHGGPGRAGGGEEMGGKRGVLHYMQRTAVQGTPTSLTNICGVFIPGCGKTGSIRASFQKAF